MSYNKWYQRINWQNRPSTATALGATNLNNMDVGINELDNRVVSLDAGKLNVNDAQPLIKNWDLNMNTGVITITQLNGVVKTYDTLLAKLAVNFDFDGQNLIVTLDDGTVKTVDLSDLIDTYTFVDSTTISFTQDGKQITASVPLGSITEGHIDSTLMEDIRSNSILAQEAANDSLQYSRDSESFAKGGVYEGDAENNAKYYKEQAEAARIAAETAKEQAESIVGVGIATEQKAGLVKLSGDIAGDATGKLTVSTNYVSETTFSQITPSMNLKSMLGKISYWFMEIGKKLDKSSIANNLVTTESGYVLDARQGPQITAEIESVRNDMEGPLVADLLIIPAAHTICHMRWDGNTLHSPYREGATPATYGFAIVFAIGESYGTMVAFAAGGSDIFTRALSGGVWSAWVKK